MKKQHTLLNTPLYGPKSKFSSATVVEGIFRGQKLYVLVEFNDGWCVCRMIDSSRTLLLKRNVLTLS